MLYLFDIDGTVANLDHRLHLIQNKPADWDAFFMAAADDAPIFETIMVARALSAHHKIILVTGRSEISRRITIDWLKKYRVPYDDLYMRAEGDHREDNIVKSELLDKLLKYEGFPNEFPPSVKISGVFEDRQQVVDMYRARGLRVFQVAKGNF